MLTVLLELVGRMEKVMRRDVIAFCNEKNTTSLASVSTRNKFSECVHPQNQTQGIVL